MTAIAIVLLGLSALVGLYYWAHALRALRARPPGTISAGAARHRFAIVIPAHDEAEGIAATVQACRALDYPADRFQVHVIADNCDDDTAARARRAGAGVLERRDAARFGKGHALAWALPRLLDEPLDAVLVLDADCRLDAHALRVFDARLAAGARVLQSSYLASNPDCSAISYMAALGSHIENRLFYAGKRDDQVVLLRGTGMVFHRAVLERLPWQAHSLAEDTEHTLQLLRAGYRVEFVSRVRVLSPFAANTEQLQVQRARWAQGNLGLGKRQALALLLEGLRSNQRPLRDAALTLLTLSRPLVLLLLLAALLSSAFSGQQSLLVLALLLSLSYLAYFALGALGLGVSPHRLRLLLATPPAVARLTLISLNGMRQRSLGWARTPRS